MTIMFDMYVYNFAPDVNNFGTTRNYSAWSRIFSKCVCLKCVKVGCISEDHFIKWLRNSYPSLFVYRRHLNNQMYIPSPYVCQDAFVCCSFLASFNKLHEVFNEFRHRDMVLQILANSADRDQQVHMCLHCSLLTQLSVYWWIIVWWLTETLTILI